jgi:hypothetical protein
MTNSLPSATETRYTSWGADSDARWNLFRATVLNGATADKAADVAGIERIPAAPKVEHEW